MIKVYLDENFSIFSAETQELIKTTEGEKDALEFIKDKEWGLTYNPDIGSLYPMLPQLITPDQSRPEVYNLPFPIAVFGTLRKNCGNHRLMNRIPILKSTMGFLPHFTAQGLTVNSTENASCPFEVYHYLPNIWREMIGPVDSLEGFDPNYGGYGYHRTLVKIRVLPDNYKHPMFNNWRGEEYANLRERRSLGIPPKEWDQYPVQLAWVYSNTHSNASVRKFANHPIIWD